MGQFKPVRVGRPVLYVASTLCPTETVGPDIGGAYRQCFCTETSGLPTPTNWHPFGIFLKYKIVMPCDIANQALPKQEGLGSRLALCATSGSKVTSMVMTTDNSTSAELKIIILDNVLATWPITLKFGWPYSKFGWP